jgi:hypothetical protein
VRPRSKLQRGQFETRNSLYSGTAARANSVVLADAAGLHLRLHRAYLLKEGPSFVFAVKGETGEHALGVTIIEHWRWGRSGLVQQRSERHLCLQSSSALGRASPTTTSRYEILLLLSMWRCCTVSSSRHAGSSC